MNMRIFHVHLLALQHDIMSNCIQASQCSKLKKAVEQLSKIRLALYHSQLMCFESGQAGRLNTPRSGVVVSFCDICDKEEIL